MPERRASQQRLIQLNFCDRLGRLSIREMSMEKGRLILKRASSGEWSDDNFDVLAESIVVGRIMRAIIAPVESPWFWTLAYGYHHDRRPTHGYVATREAAMAAFAKSWRRE